MKKIRKITAFMLSFIIAFSCMALLGIQASAVAITSISIEQYPTKMKYVQGTDWEYGYYDFPEGCTYGTFVYKSGMITFLHSDGYYTDQYPDRGMLDLTGLKLNVKYSDGTNRIVTYNETKSGNTIHQNIYANPYSNFKVGSCKICVYMPENNRIYATMNIEIVESEKFLLGDVNMDRAINSSDALLILQSVVNIKTLTAQQKALADLNSDYRINSADALEILKITVGIK